ncbi:HAMP domain-containing protein [Shewanella psychropiezotolerans]|uniref:Sensor protein n=1 Tax=Shewanella psychropiezotolerans TaxID=2593655 RepID=A0ABX5WTA9_9GAMM|nr:MULTISPECIES: histidine kinase [Shewanella]MPY25053.1 HAMP domain-containing protein [Shewanella sp. YLB-07]QDO82301.1 HAMP domain-containing protein [Shewanella psychropiezotolerans]
MQQAALNCNSDHTLNKKSSLVSSARLYTAIIITSCLLSMFASIVVTDDLRGDAEHINRVGSLRMQVIKMSRTSLSDQSNGTNLLRNEMRVFDTKINDILFYLTNSTIGNPETINQHTRVIAQWNNIKDNTSQIELTEYDQFVETIDQLVSLLQTESEKKLMLLSIIQGFDVLMILLISIFVFIKLNNSLISPLKQLVNIASEIGKGNFDLKVAQIENNELGVLSHTIHQMADQLSDTHKEYERRVELKTRQLTHSNLSLKVLYTAAKGLANYEYRKINPQIIDELEHIINNGTISIALTEHHIDNLIEYRVNGRKTKHKDMNIRQFVLKKQGHFFGDIIWQYPKKSEPESWQIQLLQAMADIVATAIELEQKKITENRLLISEERAVIARELHDSLAQSLSFLKVKMSLLTRQIEKKVAEDQVNSTIHEIKSGLNSAYIQLRELLTTFRLRLDDPSIESSLKGTVAEFTEKCQHPIQFTLDLPQHSLTANREIHLLQIIREGLSNIHRHAKASNAGVKLVKANGKILLEIWDNGIGLPENIEQIGHFGLGIMKERAKSLGADIHMLSNLQAGTIISLTFDI